MKNKIAAFLLLLSASAEAQIKEGTVVYERTMEIRRPQGLPDGVTLPPSRKDNFELMFANNQSLWQHMPAAEGDGNTISGPGMVFRMGGANDVTYYNFTAGKRLDQREILEREFLVEDTIARLPWKLTEETKTILNHTVRKATAQRIGTRQQVSMENGEMKRTQVADTALITAWFTTDVTVPAAPQEFGGQLPGLILELSLNNGRITFIAVELSAKVNASKIKEPKGGKKLTAAEFALERDKLMEEMRRNNPNSNRVTRIIN